MEENVTELMTRREAFMFLKNDIGSEWKTVGRNLGLTEGELSHIQSDNQGNAGEIRYQMLLKWKSAKGSGATVSILAEALRKSGREDLAEKLIKVRKPAATSNTRREESTAPNREINARDPQQPNPRNMLVPGAFFILSAFAITALAMYFGPYANNKSSSAEERRSTRDNMAMDSVQEYGELEIAIDIITNSLTKDEWQYVGRSLGLSDPEIDHIGEEYNRNPRERNYQMLQKWKKKFGSQATLGILEEALEKADRRDLVDKIRQELRLKKM